MNKDIVMANMSIVTPMHNTEPTAMLRLWQLISPSLPIGAYAYSQGLESAVDKGLVSNETEAQEWIEGILSHSLCQLDIPVIIRFNQAWYKEDLEALNYWNQFILASRESSELYNEDLQIARALWRLLKDLMPCDEDTDATTSSEAKDQQQYVKQMRQIETPSYALVFSLASVLWHIPIQDSIRGYLWSWCENQVAASIKLIPLGQTAGQRILGTLIPAINMGASKAKQISDDEIGSLAPGFSIACAQHEIQYSRLFRS